MYMAEVCMWMEKKTIQQKETGGKHHQSDTDCFMLHCSSSPFIVNLQNMWEAHAQCATMRQTDRDISAALRYLTLEKIGLF
jgi:hypothetical protein